MIKKKQLFASGILIILITALVTLYNYADNKSVEKINNEIVKCENVHWTHHKGDDGPEKWAKLCNGFSACEGEKQSPIDIVEKEIKESKVLQAPIFKYNSIKVDILNNERTIQFNADGNSKVILDNKNYELSHFQFHSLSEHSINGKHLPLEIQFVHKKDDKDFAVLAVLFEKGKKNDFLDKYLSKIPKTKGKYNSEEKINLLELFPQNKSYYKYKGSFTKPPCSETVNWYVFKDKLTASEEQLVQIAEILQKNYRPTMPLNKRKIDFFQDQNI